jgi:hypothetical protein
MQIYIFICNILVQAFACFLFSVKENAQLCMMMATDFKKLATFIVKIKKVHVIQYQKLSFKT